MVIDANLVPAIVDALLRAEFRTQKEAAWAVSNFTVGGTPEQVCVMSFFSCFLLSLLLCLPLPLPLPLLPPSYLIRSWELPYYPHVPILKFILSY